METQNKQSSNPDSGPVYYDRRRARSQRIAERRISSRSGTVILGLLLVLLGAVALLENTDLYIFRFKNWGALFILIPAAIFLERAYRYYRDADNLVTARVGGTLVLGFALILITIVAFSNLNWDFYGPIVLILAGIGVLATMSLRSEGNAGD